MDFNTIQSEKAKAMARYNRPKNIAKFWRFFEAVIVMFLLSWSSTVVPSAAKFTRDLAGKSLTHVYTYIYKYTYNPLIIFLVFNSIIAVLVLLSRKKTRDDAGEDDMKMVVFEESDFELPSPATATVAEDLKMVVFSESDRKIDFPATMEVMVEEEREKCNVVAENFLAKDENLVEKDKNLVGKDELVAKSECEAVSVAIKEAKKKIRRFQRTQSAILKRDIIPHQRFRRSESERAISEIDKMENLSSEEFQRRIEEFIAKHQRFLLDQKRKEKKLVGN